MYKTFFSILEYIWSIFGGLLCPSHQVEKLITARADVDAIHSYDFYTDHSYYAVAEGGWTALLLAAEKGHAAVVARLARGERRGLESRPTSDALDSVLDS